MPIHKWPRLFNWFSFHKYTKAMECGENNNLSTNGAAGVIHMSGKGDFSTHDMRKLMHNGHKHK